MQCWEVATGRLASSAEQTTPFNLAFFSALSLKLIDDLLPSLQPGPPEGSRRAWCSPLPTKGWRCSFPEISPSEGSPTVTPAGQSTASGAGQKVLVEKRKNGYHRSFQTVTLTPGKEIAPCPAREGARLRSGGRTGPSASFWAREDRDAGVPGSRLAFPPWRGTISSSSPRLLSRRGRSSTTTCLSGLAATSVLPSRFAGPSSGSRREPGRSPLFPDGRRVPHLHRLVRGCGERLDRGADRRAVFPAAGIQVLPGGRCQSPRTGMAGQPLPAHDPGGALPMMRATRLAAVGIVLILSLASCDILFMGVFPSVPWPGNGHGSTSPDRIGPADASTFNLSIARSYGFEFVILYFHGRLRFHKGSPDRAVSRARGEERIRLQLRATYTSTSPTFRSSRT